MNILDKVSAILNMASVKLGFMPNTPDAMIGIFEYSAAPPIHSFGKMDIVQNIQVRSRNTTSTTAYANAKAVALILNKYNDEEISIIQITPILDIGVDDANPPRHEYTVNFEIRRY